MRIRAAFVLFLVGSACTSAPPAPEPVPPSPTFVLGAAPRKDCPVGPVRSGHITTARLTEAMRGHLPTWAPEGFGVLIAWSGVEDATGAWWADDRCREFRVMLFPGAEGTRDWTLEYDKPKACGNYVMGNGRCIGYRAAVDGGTVSVQTIGLTGTEANRVVESIPL